MNKDKMKYCQMKSSSSYSDYVVLEPSNCFSFKGMIQHKLYLSNDDKGPLKTSWTVSLLWAVLSVLVAFTCTIGFVETEWFVRENTTLSSVQEESILQYDRTSLVYTTGMFNVCYRDSKKLALHCHRFGITKFPSNSWQSTCLLYGTGCVLQGCGILLLTFSFLTTGSVRTIGSNMVSQLHVIAGVFQTLGLLLYPLVLDTHVGLLHCGQGAHSYSLGECRVGWAYVAAAAGTVLTFYCPFLAHFSRYKDHNRSGPDGSTSL